MATPAAAYPYSPTPNSPNPGDLTSTPPTSHEGALAHQLAWSEATAKYASQAHAAARYPPSPELPNSSPPPEPPLPFAAPPAAPAAMSPAPVAAVAPRPRPKYDADLVIPPFNPNKRRAPGTNPSSTPSPATEGSPSSVSWTSATPTQQRPQQQPQPGGAELEQSFRQQQELNLQLQRQREQLAALMQASEADAAMGRGAGAAALPQRPASYAFSPSAQQFGATQGWPASGVPAVPQGLSASVGPAGFQQQQQQQQYQQMAASAGPGGSVSSRARQSVGYYPAPTTPSAADQGPYPHLYTPHPMPRQKVYFGPYILLQTLGEGEFGKVKLGVHSERWGEDVAIKLIKRGNVDTVQRGEKVRREIEVLKMVRHPNIVRLYDVIETDKYIGIVLEYASGGELFDHILAHRYLKERDATRLFAQLISGVSYLHAKGVVHRDLKLENLLLDRNRNVIITDFGFANRFNDARVDLMATSCGSPCYAAPELVVQDGKYVGTAVDVWSCGVILYAMLAGYLPYDDDPNNPEGDNINLLYKYILNTPLVFPDWITDEPRDLLRMMLVADPEQRCTTRDVTLHPWLARYRPAFEKQVEELEWAAQELERHKRQCLEVQRQWLVQRQRQQMLAAQGLLAPSMTRSQTSASSMGSSAPLASGVVAPGGEFPPMAAAPGASVAQQRHRSALVSSASTATVAAMAPPRRDGPMAPPQMSLPSLPLPKPTSVPAAVRDPVSAAAGDLAVVPKGSEEERPRSRTDSTTPASSASRRPVPVPSASNPKRRSGQYTVSSSPPTTQTEFVAAQAMPFSYESSPTLAAPASVPMAPSLSAPAVAPPPAESDDADMLDRSPGTSVAPSRQHSGAELEDEAAKAAAAGRRRKAAHRATVQIEYDGGAFAMRRRGVSREPSLPTNVEGTATETRLDVPTTAPERGPPSPNPSLGGVSISTTNETAPGEDVIMESVEEVPETTSSSLPAPVAAEEPPSTAAATAATMPFPSTTGSVDAGATPSVTAATAQDGPNAPAPAPVGTLAVASAGPPSSGTRKRKSSGSPASSMHTEKGLPSPRLPPTAEDPQQAKTSSTTQASQLSRATSVSSSRARHRPTMSADRFSIRSLLSGYAGSGDKSGPDASPAETPTAAAAPSLPSPLTSPPDAPLDDVSNRRRSSRRQKALSLQPFRRSVNSKLPQASRVNVEGAIAASRDRPSPLVPAENLSSSLPPTPVGSGNKRFSADLEANWQPQRQQQQHPASHPSPGPNPSGRAKAVMDWFRRRSTRQDTSSQQLATATEIQRTERPPSSVPAASISSTRSRPPTPAAAAAPASTQLPEQAEQTPSVVLTPTATAAPAVLPPAAEAIRPSAKAPSIASTQAPSRTTAQPSAFTSTKLRYHQGALDKNAVTYRSPEEVFAEVKQILWNMGVEMALEGDYKIKCVRRSRKKALAASVNHGLSSSNASSADRRTSIASTSSLAQSPSMGFRSLFSKKHGPSPLSTPSLNTASIFTTPTTPGSPGAQDHPDPLSSPMTKSVSQFSMLSLSPGPQPMPVYGSDKTADAGDEVRFVVELTRVKNLNNLYCVDLKRMKGGPWSFKHVYDQLLGSLELGPVV